ncbi:MAG: efflux RND transporter permease subunit [Pseudomonadota bacterium]
MAQTHKSSSPTSDPQTYGLIRTFVRHPTASNLLMAIMVLLGLFGVTKLNTQFFPTIEIPVITVSVAWSGASAEDVEKNIIDSIEPEVRFLDDVDDVTSIAREGVATLTLEYASDANMQKAQSDVEQVVARITTLPEDAEDPVISRVPFRDRVGRILIFGPLPEATIKRYAKQIRDGLLNVGIDKVTMTGARSEEILVEASESDLRRYNLSVTDIANRIRENTRDIPSGTLEGAVDIQLRTLSERQTAAELASIEVRASNTGEKVFLRDVARLQDRFDEDENIGMRQGVRAIELNVQRALTADTLKTMTAMQNYIAEIRPTLPPNLKIEVFDVRGKFVQQRLGILVKNGLQGLAIVLVVLFIFLDWRIAFWTAVGIPVAFLATLAVMYASGQSINMISMFALIMMLGIIVDDAIVVGEHTATLQQQGYPPNVAAEMGGSRMLKPVVAAMLTTAAAFFPIALISGRIGDIMSAIPLVVIAVLIASLLECFLILPGHLRHGGTGDEKKRWWFRRNFDRGLGAFRDGPYLRFVGLTYRWRYVTVAATIASLFLALGLMRGDHVKFAFFPSPPPDNISALIFFEAGTPRDAQMKVVEKVEKSIYQIERRLALRIAAERGDKLQIDPETGRPESTLHMLETSFATLGRAGRSQGENVAQIMVQLQPSERLPIRSEQIIKSWRTALPKIAGVERLAVTARRAGPPGRDVDVRLQDAPADVLKKAAAVVKEALTGFPGVSGIADDLPWGKREYVMELTPRGTALGFTGQSVGTQVRNAFEGAIATRFARGDEEVTVRVSQLQEGDGRQALDKIYLLTPGSQRVPLSETVTIRERQGFSIIQRRDGVRTVGVTADIDLDVTNVPKVVERLRTEVMPQVVRDFGISYAFKGRDEERRESFADLQLGGYLALALIFIVLAWVFESYAKPLAVMSIIPFGLVGAIVGHWVMGLPLTIISILGLLGLSGILVNDSIILMTQVSERQKRGQNLAVAAIGASQDRFRAVLLTSLTTIGGLVPLLFETSRQAEFLKPMAVTMVFGLGAATILVLVLIPAIVGIGGDIGRPFKWLWHTAWRGDDDVPDGRTA